MYEKLHSGIGMRRIKTDLKCIAKGNKKNQTEKWLS